MTYEEPERVAAQDEGYETAGRIDPTYEPAVQQYNAPVAETRSFGSRFWWIIPLLLLLILLPFVLSRCGAEQRVPYQSLATAAYNFSYALLA